MLYNWLKDKGLPVFWELILLCSLNSDKANKTHSMVVNTKAPVKKYTGWSEEEAASANKQEKLNIFEDGFK